ERVDHAGDDLDLHVREQALLLGQGAEALHGALQVERVQLAREDVDLPREARTQLGPAREQGVRDVVRAPGRGRGVVDGSGGDVEDAPRRAVRVGRAEGRLERADLA